LARIVSSACTGVKPEIMGTGPITAIQAAVSENMIIFLLTFIHNQFNLVLDPT
jgi:acetyl-CoA acetyltransferase